MIAYVFIQNCTWPNKHFAAITAPSTVASVDDLTAAHDLGVSLADNLLKAGADEILAATKKQMIDELVRQKAEKAAKQSAGEGQGNK